MKFLRSFFLISSLQSPSMRREWIEIAHTKITKPEKESPSMRREWIEMYAQLIAEIDKKVSLHAEGVD